MATYKEYKKGEYKDSADLTNAKQQNSYWGDQDLKQFTYEDFQTPDYVTAWDTKLNNLQAPGEFSFSKQQDWDNLYNQLMNMKDFSYDVNGDALYQQYKDQYVTQGKMAMMDTMGQAAALTGGYGNSYAQSVGQQAYQGYLQQLTDKVPELYQLALSKYNSDKADLYQKNDLYQNMFNNEYGMHRDKVSDFNTERNYLTGRRDAAFAEALDTYNLGYQKAYDETNSYNSNITTNRNYWSGQEDSLANREWGQYVDTESLAQQAINIYNDNAYKENQEDLARDQIDYEALKKQYEGYMSPEEVAAYQQAENSEQTKLFRASLPTGKEWARFSNGDGTYTYGVDNPKRYDSKEAVIADIIDRWVKEGQLTPSEEAWLKGYYNIDVD